MDERDLNKLREDIHILIIDVNDLKSIIREQNRNSNHIHNAMMAIFAVLVLISIILICK